MQATTKTQKIDPKVIAAVIATGLMSFCGVIVETSMNVTFPTLMKQFNVTTSTVQWMTTGYLLTVAIIVPLSATLKRRFKTKSLFITANLLFMAGVLIDATAPAFSLLLFGRIIQGLGTGIALPLMFNIILEQVPISKRGLMMGVGTLITAVAPAIGPTFGGIVANVLGWRFVFIILWPLLLISLVIGMLTISQKSAIQKVRLDGISVVLIMVTFIGLIVGFSNIGNGHFLSLSVGGALLIGVLGVIGLVYRSMHITDPVIDLRVITTGRFGGHVLAFFLLQLISLGMSFLLPNYIQLVNGSTSTIAGLVVLPGAALGAALAPISGRILDNFGARKPILLGCGLVLVCLVIFTIVAQNMSNVVIISVYLGYMFGIGLSFGNIMTSGLAELSAQQQSDGNAVLNTLQQFAGATGTSIVSAIVAASQSGQGSQAQLTAVGTQHALMALTLAMVVAVIALFRSVRVSKMQTVN
ncbi:MFS transporter [Secundilactobacillus paracollinoides]|uniref:DHA2 family efflux MFS transporter permease subunit n=1 Tax=Secundilactobacillus paracollinoides TaxID=240427 RepID=UPI0006D1EC97|nr:DHA2 family efflux MFS transporter permease subunit [Secundilactobacillus paracollinoides]ANZ60346.1 MFS transporter [Secundilactobacillus paracollinoides]ANZ62666.1 MFS transporter [Secundilactobacillus paracollinoides]KRL75083.1 major facilitator superfamily permease [Secundilactobacillus paracollinoides DSM 15502 = JCM 11969]